MTFDAQQRQVIRHTRYLHFLRRDGENGFFGKLFQHTPRQITAVAKIFICHIRSQIGIHDMEKSFHTDQPSERIGALAQLRSPAEKRPIAIDDEIYKRVVPLYEFSILANVDRARLVSANIHQDETFLVPQAGVDGSRNRGGVHKLVGSMKMYARVQEFLFHVARAIKRLALIHIEKVYRPGDLP